MPRPTRRQQRWASTGNSHEKGHPIAVPDLAIAAQLLGRPLDQVRDAAAGIRPYPHADGTPFYSLRQLAVALGIVESRPARERERAAS
jgi:hypothetical protein